MTSNSWKALRPSCTTYWSLTVKMSVTLFIELRVNSWLWNCEAFFVFFCSDPIPSRHHPHQEAEQRYDHIQPLGVRLRGTGRLGHHADPQERIRNDLWCEYCDLWPPTSWSCCQPLWCCVQALSLCFLCFTPCHCLSNITWCTPAYLKPQ